MAKIVINEANHSLDITTSINFLLPEKNSGMPETRSKGYTFDLIGSFSDRILKSLKKRKQHCLSNLFKNIDNITFNNGYHVEWKVDGKFGQFSSPSFQVLEEAIGNLNVGSWGKFLSNRAQIDQTIKAIMQDSEFDRSDSACFTFSELVSVLLEIHMFGFENDSESRFTKDL